MAVSDYTLYYTEKENGLLKKLPRDVYTDRLEWRLKSRRKVLRSGIYTYLKIRGRKNKHYSYLRLHALFFFYEGSLARIWDATINDYRPYEYIKMVRRHKLIDFE